MLRNSSQLGRLFTTLTISMVATISATNCWASTPAPTRSATPTATHVPPTATPHSTPTPPRPTPTTSRTPGNTATSTPSNTPTNTPTSTPTDSCPAEGTETAAAQAYSVPGLMAMGAQSSSADSSDQEIIFQAAGNPDPTTYKRCIAECDEEHSGDDSRSCKSGCHGGFCKSDGCDPSPTTGGQTANCCIRCGQEWSDQSQYQACMDGCRGMCGNC